VTRKADFGWKTAIADARSAVAACKRMRTATASPIIQSGEIKLLWAGVVGVVGVGFYGAAGGWGLLGVDGAGLGGRGAGDAGC
jgi:hypothetical protein